MEHEMAANTDSKIETLEIKPNMSVVPAAVLTPPELIAKALQKGVSPEVLTQLMTLQERWEANEARKAFDRAMADAKAEIKPVTKNRRVKFKAKKEGATDTNYMYEDFAAVADTIGPAFAAHGLAYRFQTEQLAKEGIITVTCIITHRGGHSERNSLTTTVDTSGNKNHIQAIGSAVTYLERYTLKASVGLAAANDDDGRSTGDGDSDEPKVTPEDIANIRALCSLKGRSETSFLKWCNIEKIEDLETQYLEDALATLGKMPDARR
jgi:ERF superfamily